MTATESTPRLALVTGASGYVGGKVVERLLDQGWRVRALVRHASSYEPPSDEVEIAEGDAQTYDDVLTALDGVDVAWYLLHSMDAGGDFQGRDKEMADTFAAAAAKAGVSRIVYLGGLHPDGEPLSHHLASRVEVGRILLDSGVPTAAVQAGVVLGDGSASFDMLAGLAERLPGAVAPRWVENHIQPIAVDDVVHYLVAAADLPPQENRTFDVGGPDVLTYGEMMQRYAGVMGMGPRPLLVAPVATPRLAAYWMGLVTPVDSTMATPLIESVLHDTVVKERDLDDLVGAPEGGVAGFDEAVRDANRGREPWRPVRLLGATAAATTATAVLGVIATTPGSLWFKTLRKPAWQPPNATFGPVWTFLYADIAVISALHVADAADKGDTAEVRRFSAALAANLMLNAAWSWVFFRGKNLPAATAVAVGLAASSADLVRRVGQRRERGVALAPYAAWTGFAAALSATLWRKNPHRSR